MTFSFKVRKRATGHSNSLWPVMLLLLLIVLVPTACVLWLMNEALVNERLAVSQKLADSYRIQLSVAKDRLDRYWQVVCESIGTTGAETSPSFAFYRCVSDNLADSVVYFGTDGNPTYPTVSVPSQASSIDLDVGWLNARRLEYEENNPRLAAEAYAQIASRPDTDSGLSALALKAQARCLLKASEVDHAVRLLVQDLGHSRYEEAMDPQGRLIVADAELLALQSLDDATLLRGLEDNFRSRGFQVLTATDGDGGYNTAVTSKPDLVILDIMLPKSNGFEVCRAIRQRDLSMPIIMLTAKGQEDDIVRGLELGADDYITKPFSIRELLARSNAFLRRRQQKLSSRFCFGNCELDLESHRFLRRGKEVELTSKEFCMLEYFVTRPGRALTRNDIMDAVWGDRIIVTLRSVDRCITTLRGKIEPDPSRPTFIKTIRNVGYRFECEPTAT